MQAGRLIEARRTLIKAIKPATAALETSDFEQWVKLASEQISAQATKLRELERGA